MAALTYGSRGALWFKPGEATDAHGPEMGGAGILDVEEREPARPCVRHREPVLSSSGEGVQ